MKFPEHELCKAFNTTLQNLAAYNQFKIDCTIYHNRNELDVSGNKFKDKIRAARYKEIGVLPGVLDYTIVGENQFVAYLEAKRKKDEYGAKSTGYLSDTQKEFIEKLDQYKIPHGVFRTVDEGLSYLKKWNIIK